MKAQQEVDLLMMKNCTINKLAMKLYIVVLIIAVSTGCMEKNPPKYVDVVRVFNEFNLSKELQKNAEFTTLKMEGELDSLRLSLTLASNTQSESYREKAYHYEQLQNNNSTELEKIVSDSDAKIWGLLNTYFKEFGEQKNISILHGGNGSGTVLYVDEQDDLTDEFLEFANNKYEGE